jgi:hypothetical protein
MKKTIVLILAVGIGLFFACKKKEDKKEDAQASTTTTGGSTTGGTPTVTPVFSKGVKVEDNLGRIYLSDSSSFKAKELSGAQLASYQKQVVSSFTLYNQFLYVSVKNPPVTAKTYPTDSLLLSGCFFEIDDDVYDVTSGSISYNSIANSKTSGTFTFVITARPGTSTVPGSRTSIKGEFKDVPFRP